VREGLWDVPSRSGTTAGRSIRPAGATAGCGGSVQLEPSAAPLNTRVRGFNFVMPGYGLQRTVRDENGFVISDTRVYDLYNGAITTRSQNYFCRSAAYSDPYLTGALKLDIVS
jgi:hypothetical protein